MSLKRFHNGNGNLIDKDKLSSFCLSFFDTYMMRITILTDFDLIKDLIISKFLYRLYTQFYLLYRGKFPYLDQGF